MKGVLFMSTSKPIYFHIDVNSAYLSWSAVHMLEQGEALDLREIPAIIGGDREKRHGVVLAKSIPAKKYGIKTGEPITDALKKCPSLTIASPNHRLYAAYSKHLIQLLAYYSSDISQYSIDECFLTYTPIKGSGDSTGISDTPAEAAEIIKDTIKNKFNYTVNIGISTNKLLAKMASDFEKPNKVHTLFPEEIEAKMWPLPVRDLFMVGKSTAAKLELLGIKTIGELAKTDPDILVSHLKSHGRIIWEYANGIETTSIDTHMKETKDSSISNSTTISYDVENASDAKHILLQLAETVGGRLRKASYAAGMVSVEIKYGTFESASHQKQLMTPSNTTDVIYQVACQLFDEFWNGNPIRLLGIRTSKLSSDDMVQLNLFDMEQNEKLRKLDKALDSIRKKYGDDAVVRGSLMDED